MYGKPMRGEGGAESTVLLVFVLWCCFTCRWVKGCGLGQKVLFRASWNLIFSRRDLSQPNEHDSFWLVLSTRYFYILLLWAIDVSDFPPWGIHEDSVLPLSSITFTVNNQSDNHFYKYAYLFQILYSMKSDTCSGEDAEILKRRGTLCLPPIGWQRKF